MVSMPESKFTRPRKNKKAPQRPFVRRSENR
jgi:hypothetical protein